MVVKEAGIADNESDYFAEEEILVVENDGEEK